MTTNPDALCPFCSEMGFDLLGLKWHLQRDCEPFFALADRATNTTRATIPASPVVGEKVLENLRSYAKDWRNRAGTVKPVDDAIAFIEKIIHAKI